MPTSPDSPLLIPSSGGAAPTHLDLPRLDLRDPLNEAHWVDGWTPGARWCAQRWGLNGLPDEEAQFEARGFHGPVRLAQRLGTDQENGDGNPYGGCETGLFKRDKGFWISLGLSEPCDQTMSTCYEQARFYPFSFPWAMAVGVRATTTQPAIDERKEWARQWELQAAETLLREHAPESHMAVVANRILQESVFGVLRHAYDLPEHVGWGALDLVADATLFFPRPWKPFDEAANAQESVETQGADAEDDDWMFFKLEPEEQTLVHTCARLFASAFFEALRQNPAFSALDECPIVHENLDDRPRWGEDWQPSCMSNGSIAAFAIAHAEHQVISQTLNADSGRTKPIDSQDETSAEEAESSGVGLPAVENMPARKKSSFRL